MTTMVEYGTKVVSYDTDMTEYYKLHLQNAIRDFWNPQIVEYKEAGG